MRVQCQDKGGEQVCLVAPNQMKGGGELARVQPCIAYDDVMAYEKLASSGARLVPAIAEAPPGYARSEKGRAFQVSFDMWNRVYLGAAWAPTIQRHDTKLPLAPGFPLGRARAETGIEISYLSPHGRSRHDIRILDASATFTDFELQGLLFSYDYQQVHRRPVMWISTFIGPPRVHDVNPPLGWGFRVLSVEDRPPAFRDTLDMEFTEVHMSWNPWQSDDMYSRLRLEVGPDIGEFWRDRDSIVKGPSGGLFYVGLSSAIRARFSLGDGGRHNLFADVIYQHPVMIGLKGGPEAVNRVKASMAYEGIFLAINDQPLSLRVAATGASRDDPSSHARSVELAFSAGLRFSFWAPAKVAVPLPELEDP